MVIRHLKNGPSSGRPDLSTMAWRRLRERVKARPGPCYYCGTTAALAWEADHLVPPSRGGAELDPRNVVKACRGCNRRKGNRTAAEFRAAARAASESAASTIYGARRWAPLLGDYTRKR